MLGMTQKQSSASGEQPTWKQLPSGPRLSALKQGQLSLFKLDHPQLSEQHPPHQEPSQVVLTAAQWPASSRPAETTRTCPDEAINVIRNLGRPHPPRLCAATRLLQPSQTQPFHRMLVVDPARVLPLAPALAALLTV
jgi:hypothetical protein